EAGQGPRYLEQGRGAALLSGAHEVGRFGEVALAVREAFDLSVPVFLAELSLTALLALPRETVQYQPLPRFPAVQRDLALVVPAEVTAGEVEAAIRGMQLPLLRQVPLFDVYVGEQLQARLGAGESDRAELTRLRQERKDVLSQVNAMLKEMEKLQL